MENLHLKKQMSDAQQLGYTSFKASSGWLSNWKKRHDVIFRKVCGKRASVDTNKCLNWIENISQILVEYFPNNIFNVNETGLFLKCLPNETLMLKSNKF